MKKTILAMALLAGATSAGAANYVGLIGGYHLAGIHYQTDTVTGANRFALGYGLSGSLEGSYERLTNLAPSNSLQPYWGVGGSLDVGLNTYYGGLFGVGVHALVGARYPVTRDFNVFAEGVLGAKYWTGSSIYSGPRLAPDLRLGFNYLLR